MSNTNNNQNTQQTEQQSQQPTCDALDLDFDLLEQLLDVHSEQSN